jgi:hypothetical protein
MQAQVDPVEYPAPPRFINRHGQCASARGVQERMPRQRVHPAALIRGSFELLDPYDAGGQAAQHEHVHDHRPEPLEDVDGQARPTPAGPVDKPHCRMH